MCPVNGNRLAPYYMGPKHTSELWVYISTPLPNPSGNTGVMLCMLYVCLVLFSSFLIFNIVLNQYVNNLEMILETLCQILSNDFKQLYIIYSALADPTDIVMPKHWLVAPPKMSKCESNRPFTYSKTHKNFIKIGPAV